MLLWLWDVVIGQWCRHKWELQEIEDVVDRSNPDDGYRVGMIFRSQCVKCGNLKVWQFKVK